MRDWIVAKIRYWLCLEVEFTILHARLEDLENRVNAQAFEIERQRVTIGQLEYVERTRERDTNKRPIPAKSWRQAAQFVDSSIEQFVSGGDNAA